MAPDSTLHTWPIGWAQSFDKPLLFYGLCALLLSAVILVCVWIKIKSRRSRSAPSPIKLDQEGQLAGHILSLKAGCKTVLLAASSLESLPINITAKTAIALAGSGKKCLLVDLDTRRNAAAKVFNIRSLPTNKPCPVPTQFDNLFLWPAAFFAQFAQTNLRNLIRSAAGRFDIILLNAPYIDGSPDRRQIASVADCAFVFCKNSTQQARLAGLLKACGCTLMFYV